MSKYIIEVDDNAVDGLFKAKGFNTLVFDQDGLDRLEKYEEVAKEVKKDSSFPQIGDGYWYLHGSCYSIDYSTYQDSDEDKNRMEIGNFFKTDADANFTRERLRVLTEMRKFTEPFDTKWDGDTNHYYIYCVASGKNIDLDFHTLKRCGEFYFESEEKARECIEAVGEDRIKKYYLGVE